MMGFLKYWLFRFQTTLRWYVRAKNPAVVRGEYLREFLREVYLDDRHYHAFDLVCSIRRHWRRQPGTVSTATLGAPSRTTRASRRPVSGLVRKNAIDAPTGKLLFRVALWLRASSILELGTNMGISGLYLHAPNTKATLHTVEGNEEVATLARQTFQMAGAGPGLRLHHASFDDWLKEHLPSDTQAGTFQSLDLLFLDGDHRYAPTLSYVKRLIPLRSAEAVFIVADIHWSPGMERAWEELKALPEVSASLDLYHLGVLFFKPGIEKEHLAVRRPWRS
jgi:predicted O-methyltransferase YrrM